MTPASLRPPRHHILIRFTENGPSVELVAVHTPRGGGRVPVGSPTKPCELYCFVWEVSGGKSGGVRSRCGGSARGDAAQR
ncbi:unnamed protein product [Danaus chrysippus]|uniref:(African queen) hypothetical protein n=1 Tax=Danaus chrysippus TaxID=151541 RepID=A0A8J2RB31_9NEOP|nr:unnamed protein product [Danaus chrysippus]